MTSGLPAPGHWIERWLSPGRFAPYLSAAQGDRVLALRLYEWNTEISSAFLHDLAHVEVGLRNCYNLALEQHTPFPTHWTRHGSTLFAPVYRTMHRFNPSTGRRAPVRSDINRMQRETLQRAISEAHQQTPHVQPPPGKIIAQLTFGFWRFLSSSAHEVTLWRTYLHHGFPAGTSRSTIDRLVRDLHVLRNRVAHYEPLLGEDLARKHQRLIELANLIDPILATYARGTTQVSRLIRNRPKPAPGVVVK